MSASRPADDRQLDAQVGLGELAICGLEVAFVGVGCLDGEIANSTMGHPDRRSIRLPAFDYSQPGLYFVTVCSVAHQPVFGTVRAGEMHLSSFGRITRDEWLRTPQLRAGVRLDAFVVMPDHVHLLFGIVEVASSTANAPPTVGATRRVAPTEPQRKPGPPAGSVGAIIGQYKSVVTKRIRQLDPTLRVWQRGYYDRVVRNEREAETIRRYIAENPARWDPHAQARDGHGV